MSVNIGPDTAGTIEQGSADADSISTGSGRDVVRAGAGEDKVDGGHNQDRLYGEDGDDTIRARSSDDFAFGGEGDDILDGGQGDDRLFGGDGSDIIIGGNGDDVLFGDNPSDGNRNEGFADLFLFDESDGTNKINDFEQGTDKIVLVEGTDYTIDGNKLYYGDTVVIVYFATLTDDDITFGSLPDYGDWI